MSSKVEIKSDCTPEQNKKLWKPGSCFTPDSYESYNIKRDKKSAENCPKTCVVDKIQIVETYEEYECFPESGETQNRKLKARFTGKYYWNK